MICARLSQAAIALSASYCRRSTQTYWTLVRDSTILSRTSHDGGGLRTDPHRRRRRLGPHGGRRVAARSGIHLHRGGDGRRGPGRRADAGAGARRPRRRPPGLASYEVCRALRDEFDELLPIIFVSRERNEPLDVVAGLLLGADDYIVEPYAPEEFVARVRRAVTRAAAFRSINERPTHTLTVREVEVLQGLANGLSQREIAQQLIISPKTVGTHIQRILGKLRVHSRAEAVAAAYQRGIVEQPQAPQSRSAEVLAAL